ncbi:hypothetical protein [Variovorax sp. Sphag1AA]|uniref:hypothetical protein n=1 Tax=Variovorax sp. Sphag1AA TaxID=2587027 RepID=UPI0016127014|nr:hypothetical protein [Variovorax sp. Sphag1AA]MBB3179814.1 hypothetical protein [Variovorax sp. Sphag1AA]
MSPLLATSDKSFWHGYTGFYARHFPKEIKGSILEFGVFKGNSIRWLLTEFPNATIFGADILPVQPEWPIDARVTYIEVDQGHEAQVAELVQNIDHLELIIEDGSHVPLHQSTCLKHGMSALMPGGTYVLEDIHTSHPAHSQYKDEFGNTLGQTSLSVLLGVEHLLRRNQPATTREIDALANGSHFSVADVSQLLAQIGSIEVYKRTTMPSSCWRCGSTAFDYHRFKCECGVDLMHEADSMTIVVKKRR